jgi:DNA-binding NarL/FixJ family response regulator
LDAALTVYDRLGARHLAVGCAAELAACGLVPRGRRDSPVGLSPQELAIARVVASGATNREVAAELVVSVKTVEHHLTAVYAKLGVRSRTELAARMAASLD